jgi:hypothetical protein
MVVIEPIRAGIHFFVIGGCIVFGTLLVVCINQQILFALARQLNGKISGNGGFAATASDSADGLYYRYPPVGSLKYTQCT